MRRNAKEYRGDLLKRFNEVVKQGRVLAVTAVLAVGLSAASVLPAQAEDGTGSTVSGTVTIAKSTTDVGVPLVGAKVCEGGPDYNCVLTGADGSYTLTNVQGWAMYPGMVFYPTVYPVDDAQAKVFGSTHYGPSPAPSYIDLVPGGTITGIDIAVVAFSASTGDVNANDTVKNTAPLTAARAKIAGTTRVGKVLRLKMGRWSPAVVSFRYQWYRNGHRIAGATKKTYRLTAKDRRKRIEIRVVGTAGDQSLTIRSPRTARVR